MLIKPPPELQQERARILTAGVDPQLVLTSALAADALALGARDVDVVFGRPWAFVAADRDWITSQDTALETAFSSYLLWPGTSKYFRSESRLLAVASSVFVWVDRSIQVISGEMPPLPVRNELARHSFAVGFSCE